MSFNQAIGATTPFFTAVFAYLMTLKREAWLTYVTLIPVVTGVVIASGVRAFDVFFDFFFPDFVVKLKLFLLLGVCVLKRSRN